MTHHFTALACALALVVLAPAAARADGKKVDCPKAVTEAVTKAFPGATIKKCKAEKERGHDQFEVKLDKDGHKVEVAVAPDGKILATEEIVPLDQVPAAVTKAFAARYHDAQARRAEKETHADGKSFYELAFDVKGAKREATFAEDGSFIEEE